MAALLVNPRKRRKSSTAKKRKSIARRVKSLVPSIVKRTSISKYRRNPAPRAGTAAVMATVKEGAIGAAGAIAAEVILSKLPLGAQFKPGGAQYVVASALASVGVGIAVAKYGKKPALGKAMAQGGVTVALHQTMRGFVAAPLGLKTVGYYGDDYSDMGYTEPTEVYDEFDEEELGYFVDQY